MIQPLLLLVDDDDDYRRSLRSLLESEGFRIEEATSVQEAQSKLNIIDFDLVLADLSLVSGESLQNTAGFDVAKMTLQKKIPCIIITAYANVTTSRAALSALGAHPLAIEYIPKTEGSSAILETIRKLSGLTLLHISDLHPRVSKNGEEPPDQEQAYETFLDDVSKQPRLSFNPIRAIIVSGDISFRGQSESFDMAQAYLEKLANHLRIPREQIVLVPGNHDINRKKALNTQDTLRAMRTKDTEWFSKFDDYLEFTRHLYGEPAFSQNKLYRLFMIEDKVAVAAFNSCLVEGDPDHKCQVCASGNGKEHYYGWINREQIKQAGDELDSMKWEGLRIAVVHHHVVPENWDPLPEECQGDQDYFRPYHHKDYRLKQVFDKHKFQALLHGHRHKIQIRQPQTLSASEPKCFGSGAFWTPYNDDQETANYLLFQLSPIDGSSRVIMRKYNHGTNERWGYWGADNTIHPDGIIPLDMKLSA